MIQAPEHVVDRVDPPLSLQQFLPLLMQRIFIYGTLKRGLSNSHYMTGQSYVGEARTKPVYRLMNLGDYPGMIPADCNGLSIRGEVWDVDAECRKRLDVLEGIEEGMYELVPAQLLTPFDDQSIMTYLYRWPTGGCQEVGEEWVEG